MLYRLTCIIQAIILPALFPLLLAQNIKKGNPIKDTTLITIHYTPGLPANRIVPLNAIGAGIDGHEFGDNNKILRPENIKMMSSASLYSLSYRLRTELGGEVWHWNPSGSWSDARHHCGYWISKDQSKTPISLSYGYKLPRRGNTIDQANDDGYSRIDDGDFNSFWKSNPYLDSFYTKEPNNLHQQWVVADLGSRHSVNKIEITWGQLFAKAFRLEYAEADPSSFFNAYAPHQFKKVNDIIYSGHTGRQIITINTDLKVRLLKIILIQPLSPPARANEDIRDVLGYSINELKIGRQNENNFTDFIHHMPSHKGQSVIYVSSTDPWHRKTDIDLLTEQPGIDKIFNSELTHDLPVLFPAGVVYDTPENATNLVRYLKKKHYKVAALEMGEEPDGQYIWPEDFGALYLQFVQKIKDVVPDMITGGPSFQGISPFVDTTKFFSEKQWLGTFLNYLNRQHKTGAFQFFSFEWYPFDDVCQPAPAQLLSAPGMLKDVMSNLKTSLLPPHVPVYITEFGYSVLASSKENKIEGALLNADIMGAALTYGADRVFLYGYEPGQVMMEDGCSWGNMMLFGMDDNGKILFPTALYYGAKLVSEKWAAPFNDTLEIYPASNSSHNANGQEIISAYAIKKKNNRWSVLLINKDPSKAHMISLRIINQDQALTFSSLYQYGSQQYAWGEFKEKSRPLKNLEPVHKILSTGMKDYELPPYSITILTDE